VRFMAWMVLVDCRACGHVEEQTIKGMPSLSSFLPLLPMFGCVRMFQSPPAFNEKPKYMSLGPKFGGGS